MGGIVGAVTWYPVAKVGDVRAGDVIPVVAGGAEIALGRDGDRLFAVQRACLHQGGDLAMLGLDAGSVSGNHDSEDERIEIPAIDLSRLGDGEGLKDITERAVRAVERAAIAAALRSDRNPAAAAKRLGISRASIYTKMKTYGLGADGTDTAE